MNITFDEPKRLSNIAKHDGLDFASLTVQFFETAAIFPAKGDRLLAIGVFEGIVIAVVFQPLGTEALAVISMRPASRKERDLL
ncbi:hypothetical protein JP75_05920 [Devosia riboflavina]|uniref:Toxin n=1 Tax=Devosia riboflavina TaxID=46914 RepID=A0A087M4X9_9HYPH|nr:BrnT family toxin [Devosia riboflavina]KFL31932.1 hypothetical protein JP75_05920 [Devosia riboflavina]